MSTADMWGLENTGVSRRIRRDRRVGTRHQARCQRPVHATILAQIVQRNARASVLYRLVFAVTPGARDRRFGVPKRPTRCPDVRGVREPVIGEVAARQPASAFVSSMSNPSRNSLAARSDLST
jgi:hypothetical protein